MGEQDVQPPAAPCHRRAQLPDPGARVEDELRPVRGGDLHARGVSAEPLRRRPRHRDRAADAPEPGPHQLVPVGVLAGDPEEDHRAVISRRPEQRERAGLDLEQAALAADSKAGVGGPALAHRDRQRELVGRQRRPVLVEGPVAGVPLLAASCVPISSNGLPTISAAASL